MKTQHTPGEWRVLTEEKGFSIESFGESEAPRIIAKVHRYYTDNKANAKLIAAAPEMLKALEYAAQTLEELSRLKSFKSRWPEINSIQLIIEETVKKATNEIHN